MADFSETYSPQPLLKIDNTSDLFSDKFSDNRKMGIVPLALRMRPRNLDEIMGQTHVIKPAIIDLVRRQSLGSVILYGPPGSGKTSIAEAIAHEEHRHFIKINAVLSNATELREILKSARPNPSSTVLLIDEIHRFNKAQQDLLLPDVEAGIIQLIGATTHNPGFYVINPLLSRCRLIELEPLAKEVMIIILKNALQDSERGLGASKCILEEEAFALIAEQSNGDARRALNLLESIILNAPTGQYITTAQIEPSLLRQPLDYDADEDAHYNTISAFIKSIRGCDPDAAVYWLTVMLESGEDPRFIARRLLIIASEDIGLADSRAITIANACFDACERLGMPECRITLAHTTIFCALMPKSNSAYLAIDAATAFIRKHGKEAVPIWLRDAHGAASKALEHGKYYQYSHDFDQNISGQEYMLTPKTFYNPKFVGAEKALAEHHHELQQFKNSKKA